MDATMQQFRLCEHGSIEGLKLHDAPSPEATWGKVVVKVKAASLNARDLMVIVGPSPYGPQPGLIPLSDGAGEVIGIGEGVTRFRVGDRVVASFRQGWIDGLLSAEAMGTDLGGAINGVLSEQISLQEDGLVAIPDNLTFEAAATLPCAGVTAFNALYGGAGLSADHIVLIQGTGGVSMMALQIAIAAGARVIATTSSPEKALRLKALGASHVVDYIQTPDWDSEVLRLTGGRGVDRIVEVGGAGSLPQSFNACSIGAEIDLVGMLDNPFAQVSPFPVVGKLLSLRGVLVGSRTHLERLVALAAGSFEPVIDSVFAFSDAKAALNHLAARAHFGKVIIGF
jgi:NADPH:quinone reductase-like Zn-dependent oxidoreductase